MSIVHVYFLSSSFSPFTENKTQNRGNLVDVFY